MRQNVNMSKACFMPSSKTIAEVKKTNKKNCIMPQVGTFTRRETEDSATISVGRNLMHLSGN